MKPWSQPEERSEVAPQVADVPAGFLTERVNVVALESALDNGKITRKVESVRRFLADRKQRGIRIGDFVVCRVNYYRKHNIPGRRYPMGTSVQFSLSKEARPYALEAEEGCSAISGNVFFEIDIDNCFVALLCNCLEDASVDMADYPTLMYFKTIPNHGEHFFAIT